MSLAIKLGAKYSSLIKYILINEKTKNVNLVLNKNLAKEDFSDIRDKVEENLRDYDLQIVQPLSFQEEIYLIWPQIIEEFKDKFSFVNGWLSRANLNIKENLIQIEVENKMASTQIKQVEIERYLKKCLKKYLEQDISIEIINGNFAVDIPQTKVVSNKKVKKTNNKKGENSKTSNNNNNNIIYGGKIREAITHSLGEVKDEGAIVIISAQVFACDQFQTKSGTTIITFSITDKSNSITCKLFLNKKEELKTKIKKGMYLKVKGEIRYDRYSKGLVVFAKDICQIEVEQKKDEAEEKRIELHLHTQMSALDAVCEVDKVIARAAAWGHPAIAITDHGVAQAFPKAFYAGQDYGIKVIYGLEAYLVDDGEAIVYNCQEEVLDNVTYTVFDLETTGLNNKQDEIIEIGAVKIVDGQIVDQFSTMVKPKVNIPAKITKITGITDEMVKDAPCLEDILDDFLNFCQDTVLVAHNASFDYGFLRQALVKIKKEKEFTVLDTLALSRALLPNLKRHKLDTLATHFKVELTNHHRAVNDAQATAEILIKLLAKTKDYKFNHLAEINKLISKISWKDLPVYHALLLVKNQAGLKQLYRLISNSHIEHFYRKPRILKSELSQNRDNLIIGSACEAGQIYQSILANKPEYEIEKIARFYDFLEVQPLGNNMFMVPEKVESVEKLQEINKTIYKLGKKLNKLVIATGDVHFIEPEDSVFRKVLQAGQGYKVEEQAPLYFRTTEEMLVEFNYFDQNIAKEIVIDNPQKINGMIEEIRPIPKGLFTPKIEGAEQQIKEMSYQKAKSIYGEPLPEIVEKRLKKELKSIIDNGYAVIYLISHKLVKKSLDEGYLVGSRGSVGSSLVATMCGITEVNPLPPHYYCPQCQNSEFNTKGEYGVGVDQEDKNCPSCGTKYIKDGYDIPFEVFLGFKGDKVPDIDLNFSGEYQAKIHEYTEELFGRDYVFKAGTVSTIASRTAYGFVKGYIDDNYLELNQAEINRLVAGCTGVRRTTGQHPGGMIVVPSNQEIYHFTPIQKPANDMESNTLTTHFEFKYIHDNLLKLDLLGHDDPTAIKLLQDLTGVDPKSIPLDDQDTMAIFSKTESLGVTSEEIDSPVGTFGIPEFGTNFVRQMLVDTKPTTMAELIRISGLSHGTDVWLNNAQNLIKKGQAKLAQVISVRDDIMNYLMQKGLEPAKAFWIMEHVRKGKGLTAEEEEYMQENNIPAWYIDSCKKIKYMFPKAHAAAYVMMAYRIAYFKVHYPQQFYTVYFSIKADDFDAHMVCQGLDYIKKIKQEIEEKGKQMTAKEKGTLTVLEIVIEAMARGIKFKNVDLYESDASKFILTDDGLLPPLISLQGLGSSAAAKIAVTREENKYLSIEDMVNKTRISKTVVEIMQEHGTLADLPEKNQLTLF